MLMAMGNKMGVQPLSVFFRRGWNFQRSFQSKGDGLFRVFSEYRLDSDDNFDKVRASASELLGVYASLKVYMETEVDRTEETHANWESWSACCSVVDYILLVRNQRITDMNEAAKELRRRY